jgi:putative transcriptional regulator
MQKWLAEKNGKSCPLVNGNVQNKNQPRLEVLFKIARLLEIHPKELLATKPQNGIQKFQNNRIPN